MKNPWFHLAQKGTDPSGLHLFSFPYAGGSISAFRPLAQHLAPDIHFHIAALPGRGSRFAEKPVKQLPTLVNALSDAIEQTQPAQFAFYGHSMGGILGFEVARELRRRGFTPPLALIVSGVTAPELFGKPEEAHRYNLPREAFIDYLQTLEGTPQEFFEHPELMEMMLPILRADFQICDTYQYTPEAPLEMPIMALFGTDDHDVGKDGMQAWSKHTYSAFRLSEHEGGHFFVNHQWPLVARKINELLRAGR